MPVLMPMTAAASSPLSLLLPQSPTVAIETHGCKLNQADSSALARQFAAAGCRPVAAPAGRADVVVVNTCTVTAAADAKARQALRAARRKHPDAVIIAAGCYPQRAAAELRALPEVSLVVGNADKPQLVAMALAELARRHPAAGGNAAGKDTTGGNSAGAMPADTATAAAGAISGPAGLADPDTHTAAAAGILRRSRAMVKIQEGCDQVCAYCIVPKVRGRERSIPPDDIIAAIRRHWAAGFQEVTLTGTQLGTYGFDLDGGVNLRALLTRILSETDLPRLRVSSLQAHEITPDLLARWRYGDGAGRLCPHFHIPLQSGCDAILRAMRRRYDTAAYRRAVGLIRDSIPDAAVTADIIVGFPGETPAQHDASRALAAEMRFADLHIFPYSPRPGTTAYYLPEPVSAGEKRRRAGELAAVCAAAFAEYRSGLLGQTRPVLWETARPPAPADSDGSAGGAAMLWSGLTDNYIRVTATTDANLANRITPARLVGLEGKTMRAALPETPPPSA